MASWVTGGTGFIGSHLIDALLKRVEMVHALVHDPAKAASLEERGVFVTSGDMQDPAILRAAVQGVSVVYHCAAASEEGASPEDVYMTNLAGARNVLKAVRSTPDVRVVLLTGLNVLGLRNLEGASEDLGCRTAHDPGTDVKIAIERLAQKYARRWAMPITILRPAFTYGSRDKRNLPRLLEAIREGGFSFMGNRNNVVPLVHVSDLVQAMLLAAEVSPGQGRVYHITDGSQTTIGDLAGYLAELQGCPAPRKTFPFFLAHAACATLEFWQHVMHSNKPPSIPRSALFLIGTSRFVDISRAVQELGYAPQVSYRLGMAETVRWIKEHSHASLELSPH